MTSLGPENSTESLIRNNYDDDVSHMMETKKDKTDYVVELKISEEDVEKCTDQRDVQKHSGDLDLSNLDHKIYKREKNN